MPKKTIYTIGHSTLDIGEFIGLLKKNGIGLLVDIRSLPGSRAYPQFNQGSLKRSLKAAGVGYIWIEELGGRRRGLGKHSPNKCWKNASFRGYADYMMTKGFTDGIKTLGKEIRGKKAALMCAEAVYWRCHRMMVSDYLKSRGYRVLHMIGKNKPRPHKYSECAKIIKGKLSYL